MYTMNNHSLADALRAFNNYHKNAFVAITKIVPCVDGILFETETDVLYKYYYIGSYIEKHHKDDWRKMR